MSEVACRLVVAGRVDDKHFQAARKVAEELAGEQRNVTCEVVALLGTEWADYVKEQSERLGVRHKLSPLVFYNSRHFLGGHEELAAWAEKVYGFVRPLNGVVCQSAARKELRTMLKERNHTFCFLDVAVGGDARSGPEGKAADVVTERVVVELFDDLCPTTCGNFKQLCVNKASAGGPPSFENTPFHRAVTDGWVQGGDVVDGSGRNSVGAITAQEAETFPDENFAVKHDRVGIVSMANTGASHSNGSQFFVTLKPLPWLDQKRVAIGRVVYGMRAFHLIEQLPRNNERPQGLCKIYNCGEYDPEKSSLQATRFVPAEDCEAAEEKHQ